MDTLQIRLGTGLVEQIDKLVKQGIYSSRSDAIREAVRHFFWHSQAGTMKYKENSVKLARKAREKLSKENVNLQEINTL